MDVYLYSVVLFFYKYKIKSQNAKLLYLSIYIHKIPGSIPQNADGFSQNSGSLFFNSGGFFCFDLNSGRPTGLIRDPYVYEAI